jgi:hypothetical protein
MSPLSLMPSGRIFLLPPMSRQVTAFLMSNRVKPAPSAWTWELTEITKDTRSDTACESLKQAITPRHLLKLFFLLWREAAGSGRGCERGVELDSEHAEVRMTKRRCARRVLALGRGKGGVDTRGDDTRARDDLGGEVSAGSAGGRLGRTYRSA